MVRAEPNSAEVTRLLESARRGGERAVAQLMPLIYDELRRAAHRQLGRRRPGQTLDTTALVHEAYLKLVDASRADWRDRNHFLSVAAVAMRHILIDYARRRSAGKRGGRDEPVTLDERRLGVEARTVEILALDDAMTALAAVSERLARLVELRFFGGLSVEETAEVLAISERTVKRDWRKARAFLFSALNPAGTG